MLSRLQTLPRYINTLPCATRLHTIYTKYNFTSKPLDPQAPQCDVAIIGGGFMGLNTAYQIARRSNLSVQLFERFPSFGYSSSGYSSAILRSLYSKDTMIEFANNGIYQYKHWQEYLNTKETTGSFVKTGWLLMSAMSKDEAVQTQTKLTSHGIPTSVIDKQTMHNRFPQINSDCGMFDNADNIEWVPKHMDNSTYFVYEEDAGCFEPTDALYDLNQALSRYANVSVNYNCTVTDVLHEGGKVKGVEINDKQQIHSPIVINCNGPFYNEMIAKLDLDIKFTLRPVRMQVIYKDTPQLFMEDVLRKYKCTDRVPIPIIVDYFSGIYLRPLLHSKQIACGTCKEEEEQDVYDPSTLGLPNGADPEMREKFLHSMYHRLCNINELGRSVKVHHISGLYTKTDDVHYLIGNTKLDGFIVCNGFSGHGQKCAPAVGSIIAQYVTKDKLEDDTNVDIEFFSPYREPYIMKTKNVLA